MMLHRIKGVVAFECDYCGDQTEYDFSDFYEAKQAAQDTGWIFRKLGNDGDPQEWHHFCGDECFEAHIDEQEA